MKTFPVIEVFGPTIQGEGFLAGLPTLFVRFGGCDYRCEWCDSMYAVEPAEVRENAEKMTCEQITDVLVSLVPGDVTGMWVTLSGGNPALMQFDSWGNGPNALPEILRKRNFKVSVETQGSVWRAWLNDVNHLTVSPKPPSSGMATERHEKQTARFLEQAAELLGQGSRSLKVVVFDDADYEWARDLINRNKEEWPFSFVSAGTDQDHLQDEYRVHAGIAERYGWLCERVASDPLMRHVRVLPQLHVIAFGTGRGV